MPPSPSNRVEIFSIEMRASDSSGENVDHGGRRDISAHSSIEERRRQMMSAPSHAIVNSFIDNFVDARVKEQHSCARV